MNKLYENYMNEALVNIDVNRDGCHGCPKFVITTDASGTGDSPTALECEAGSYKECPREDDLSTHATELLCDALVTLAHNYDEAILGSLRYNVLGAYIERNIE